MIPITRKDHYLNEIVGWGDTAPEKPYIEEEFFFAEILGEAVQAPEPLPRYQMYLTKIAGRNIDIPYPETRLEYFLARAAGMDIKTPVPITKEEIYWSNYTAIVEFEFEGVPPLTYKAIEGTLADYRIYGQTVDGESVGDLVTSGEHAGEYKVPVTVEGKNLLPRITATYSKSGILLRSESDGTVVVNGTATARTFFTLRGNISYPFDTILSGCPQGGSTEGYCLRALTMATVSIVATDFGNGALIPANTEVYIEIRIENGFECNNLEFKPMIRKADIEDDTYEPYRTPVTTPIYLPEQIRKVGDEAEYIDYREQKQHRVRRNLLNILANTAIVGGIHFTVNSDKSITIVGNLNASKADFYLITTDSLILNRGEYLVFCENASTNAKFIIGGSPSTGHVPYTEIIDDYSVEVSCSGGGIGYCLIRVTSDIENPITLYPMIRLASIEDDTYEPYIENTELDVTLPALPTLPGTNVLSVGTAVQPSKVYVKYKGERQ